ncbi:MAG: Gfo/Idh/MocA family oxidoreductase, partial [Eubacteriales bacterium]|nr:Gfo/Idh/MocA family oxidoreductase [Eubacteriales bacterium]
ADADAIIAAGKKHNVKVCACHQNRFNKSIQKIREAVEQKRFGRLLHGAAHIRWNRGKNYYEQAPWRGTWEQDGGALMNQCIHNIDLLRWMMGDEITEVFAYTDKLNHSYIQAEDLGLAVVKFANGSYGLIEGTVNVFPKNLEETLYIFGERGTVKAGGKSVNIIENWNFADNLDDATEIMQTYAENPSNVYGFGHTPLYANMVQAIQNDVAPYVDAQAGKRALELVLAIYLSAATGKAVQLPLQNVASIDFTGRFS